MPRRGCRGEVFCYGIAASQLCLPGADASGRFECDPSGGRVCKREQPLPAGAQISHAVPAARAAGQLRGLGHRHPRQTLGRDPRPGGGDAQRRQPLLRGSARHARAVRPFYRLRAGGDDPANVPAVPPVGGYLYRRAVHGRLRRIAQRPEIHRYLQPYRGAFHREYRDPNGLFLGRCAQLQPAHRLPGSTVRPPRRHPRQRQRPERPGPRAEGQPPQAQTLPGLRRPGQPAAPEPAAEAGAGGRRL